MQGHTLYLAIYPPNAVLKFSSCLCSTEVQTYSQPVNHSEQTWFPVVVVQSGSEAKSVEEGCFYLTHAPWLHHFFMEKQASTPAPQKVNTKCVLYKMCIFVDCLYRLNELYTVRS